MLTTEAEAKTKWCPDTRVEALPREDISASVNRYGERPPDTPRGATIVGVPADGSLCIASGCMAWRWADMGDSERASDPILGYCGRAGRP